MLESEIGGNSKVQGVKNIVENKKGRKVKFLRSNNGGEYTSVEFKAYLAGEGIEHQLSISGRPEQNRIVESMNRTLKKCACSMRLQADMSEEFWAEMVSHACYLFNRSPSSESCMLSI